MQILPQPTNSWSNLVPGAEMNVYGSHVLLNINFIKNYNIFSMQNYYILFFKLENYNFIIKNQF